MPCILIIDDDQSLRDSLRRTLQSKGYVILEATEGNEGIKVINTLAIDVAIVDLFMPGKEGLETILEIRRSHPTLKVIAMSGGKGQARRVGSREDDGALSNPGKAFYATRINQDSGTGSRTVH